MKNLPIFLISCLFLISSALTPATLAKAAEEEAEEESTQAAETKSQDDLPLSRLILGARSAFGMRGEDGAYQLELYAMAERPLWLVALRVPLLGLMHDKEPSTATYRAMGLLKAHWDDPGDIGRVIGTLRIGYTDGPVLLILGRESGRTIYQGTLIDNLYTQLNPDASGLTMRAEFHGTLGELGILVAEPFNPALVAIYGAIRPLATVFKERPNLSSLAINLAAFIDPTIIGTAANYGLDLEIEERLSFKNIYITPFTSYAFNYKRSALGGGLEFGYENSQKPQALRASAALSFYASENYPQAVGALYFIEREVFPFSQPDAPTYQEALDAWPDKWHMALKLKTRVWLPERLLVQYSMLMVPAVGQGEGLLHVQGSFLNRFSVGTILLLKRYAPIYANNTALWGFMASLEGAVKIWHGLTATASYSYLVNSDTIARKSGPAHQFFLGFGYEFGLGKKKEP